MVRLPPEMRRSLVPSPSEAPSSAPRTDAPRRAHDLDAIERNLPALLDFPVDADSPPFEGPTLFVRGALSDYVRDSDTPVIRRLFPHAEIVTVADAGHWVHAEQPAAFLQLAREFLQCPNSSDA